MIDQDQIDYLEKQIEEANANAKQILLDIQKIKLLLGIEESPKERGGQEL
jgi:hypothetical protein